MSDICVWLKYMQFRDISPGPVIHKKKYLFHKAPFLTLEIAFRLPGRKIMCCN